jgi:hypothetical protein
MLVLFTLALFVNSALLFLVQPMVAKMLLPLHCLLLLLPLFFLPLHLPAGASPPRASTPIPWLLLTLAVTVGLPFFVTATGGPLLQRWFAATRHKAAEDPYFLYAASNLGSFCGLFGYLFLLEPRFTLAQQSRIWAAGYLLAALLIGVCAAVVIRTGKSPAAAETGQEPGAAKSEEAAERISLPRKLRWVALAAAPSSLMLGVTTYLATDIASFPLLWVLPLALYLLTFMAAFSRMGAVAHPRVRWLMPAVVLLQAVVLSRSSMLMPAQVLGYLVTFGLVALVCHGELARDRPSASRLTEFYLLLSLGGVIGGAFTSIVAPVVFNGAYEYPIALVIACYLCLTGAVPSPAAPTVAEPARPPGPPENAPAQPAEGTPTLWPRPGLPDVLLGTFLAALTALFLYGVYQNRLPWRAGYNTVAYALIFPAVVCFSFRHRPVGFALGLGAILTVSILDPGSLWSKNLVYQQRTFFGILKVARDRETERISLTNGTTLHGMQDYRPGHRRDHISYYWSTGPIAQTITKLRMERKRMAVIGLGTGSLAAFGERGQKLTYYEIDPAVERIAWNPSWFTYLSDARARGVDLRVVMGDARLRIQEAEPHSFDLIVLDAFSSDSIPVHLLTREALALYLDKLSEHGVIAYHVSNRHLSLLPVVGGLAADAGIVARYRHDAEMTDEERKRGKATSVWAIVARREADFGPLAEDTEWFKLWNVPGHSVWTDDYSNIVSVIGWW